MLFREQATTQETTRSSSQGICGKKEEGMKLTLGRKLGLGFGVILALMVFSSTMSYLKSAAIKQSEDITYEVRIPEIMTTVEAQRDLNGTQNKGREFILATDPVRKEEVKKLFEGAWGAVEKDVSKMDELAPTWTLQANRDRLQDVEKQLPLLRAAQEAAMAHAVSSDRDAVIKAGHEYAEQATPTNEAIKKTLNAMADSFQTLLAKTKEDSHAENRSLNVTMAVTTFAALGIGIFLAIFLIRSITAADTREKLASAEFAGQLAAIGKSQAVIEFKMDGTILTANDNFLNAMGYTLDEVKGKHHSMFVDEAHRQSGDYREFWAKLNRGEYQAGEYKRIGKGGREVWIQASYNPIMDLNGKPFKVVKYATDITQQVKIRQEVAQGAEREKLAAQELKEKVDSILAVVAAAAKGDLTQEIPVHGSDAIGQMGEGLGKFFADLRQNIGSIGESSVNLSAAAEELTAVSQQMSANAEETSTQTKVVSNATLQVSQNLQTVATGAEEMGASIKEIAKNASEAAKVATSAVKVAETANATVSKLGDSSAEIGQVIKVITSIAQQTNLLALNATIEAARAGEAGKGFAVVANEVKELAKETAKATEDISRKIEAIQTDTKAAVDAIASISGVINQINDISSTIATAVEEQNATTNEMSRNVSEAAQGSGEITSNIAGVAQAAESTSRGASDTQKAAQQLVETSAELRRLVEKFKIDAREEGGPPHAGVPAKRLAVRVGS
jgi:methyl-accepting chemotaxis protein